MTQNNFQKFSLLAAELLPANALITEYSKRYAYGTDASFYRLTPQLIIQVDNREQLRAIVKLANAHGIAITFRAAGTSLSGQAVTDSVLIVLSDHWTQHTIHEQGNKITLQPGIIGAKANRLLKPYAKKIGPDPASINSCKIGGIAANNSSGMCCGVKQNSYHTLADMSLIFADGSELNTACEESCSTFLSSHQNLITQLLALAKHTKENTKLKQKIIHKYRLKNTTGYGINALIDFSDPIEIIKHLMIGSEGTLGFIADITFNTVEDNPYKSAGFFIFDNTTTACQLIQTLADLNVNAVELLDKRALMSVADHDIMPEAIAYLPEHAVALLIEVQANEYRKLAEKVERICVELEHFSDHIITNMPFSADSQRNEALWNIRKETFPAVGAIRKKGTTVIIEDVAFPLNSMALGITELQKLFNQFGYHEAIIFGHALAGNLHFVFTQSFDTPEKITQYDNFMAKVANLVAVRLQGSLKAEHGTGRNMAPFVELEWGKDAYRIMKEIKVLFDQNNILNPGVIINDDKKAHIKNLKLMPEAHNIIDKCIECGFCESVCPSEGLTLTPRQRISVWRRLMHINKLIATDRNLSPSKRKKLQQEYQTLHQDYQFLGIDSCAATGLCGMECPVGINTGEFIKALRQERFEQSSSKKFIANTTARHLSTITKLASIGFNIVNKSQVMLGTTAVTRGFKVLNKISNGYVPLYFSDWPKGEKKLKTGLFQPDISPNQKSDKPVNKVVYLPACAGRVFATTEDKSTQSLNDLPSSNLSLPDVVISVLNKAGFEVIIPDESASQCCGMAFSSKGDTKNADTKAKQTFDIISKASNDGQYPVIIDASACALHLKDLNNTINFYEVIEFVSEFALPKLTIGTKKPSIMLHVTCSSKRGHFDKKLIHVAKLCAEHVEIPADISCCGFAGDKGFFQPNLNKHALKQLKAQQPTQCEYGYSNNRSCEIGLTRHSGIPYQSILYLLDEISEAKDTETITKP
ncbi:FAD-binding and (Fe-S)-binding domain-containing protein [Colwellia sp. RSH04]|uniref:FAD-binding and (Fe-S)-binding domain-containing protein n=1 Tax=Colwellia sp. RSH04 TaxID=2305464 RepID=UPI000E590B31|nr:FAD-binding and (Fe-S)-binding domain-containing protein [Colwellia sp. RSH04]RHW76485.1 FAD-binding oxidoreductase [Colwellia sp. RSH04]